MNEERHTFEVTREARRERTAHPERSSSHEAAIQRLLGAQIYSIYHPQPARPTAPEKASAREVPAVVPVAEQAPPPAEQATKARRRWFAWLRPRRARRTEDRSG